MDEKLLLSIYMVLQASEESLDQSILKGIDDLCSSVLLSEAFVFRAGFFFQSDKVK